MGNILIVDDEDDITYAMKRLLEEEGYEVNTAVNCSDVIELLETEYFDAVIGELFLKEEDGFQILETVQQYDEDLPFIMIIERENENLGIQALEMGAYDYIYKPMIYTDIINTLYRAVEKRTLYVDKVTAEEDAEVANQKLNCLSALAEAFSSSGSDEEGLDKFLETLIKTFSATCVSVFVLDTGGVNLKFLAEKSKYTIKSSYKVGQLYSLDIFPFTGQVIESKKTLSETGVIDLSSDISLQLKQETGNDIYCSFMEIPVIYRSEICGIIHVKCHEPFQREFTDHEIKLADLIGKYSALAVNNIKMKSKV